MRERIGLAVVLGLLLTFAYVLPKIEASSTTVHFSASAVTPSDVTVLPPTTALWVGGAGAVAVVLADGTTATFSAVPAGYRLPVSVTKVKSTGTTATLILGLY